MYYKETIKIPVKTVDERINCFVDEIIAKIVEFNPVYIDFLSSLTYFVESSITNSIKYDEKKMDNKTLE